MIFLTEGQQIDKSGYLGDPPIGSFYNVGGHRLFLDCSGSGSPSVVFIPAAGMVGLDYLNIHHEISQYATSVIYDRAGKGLSDHVKIPLCDLDDIDELLTIHHVTSVLPPDVV